MSTRFILPTISGESICPYCGVGCRLHLDGAPGQPPRIRGVEDAPANLGGICAKGALLGETIATPDRLSQPQFRHNHRDSFQPTDWDSAFHNIREKFAYFRKVYGPDAVAFYGSGQLDTETAYLVCKLFKGFFHTNNTDSNSRLCMASAVTAYRGNLGSDGPPTCYEDIDLADVIFIAGSNMAEAHPVLFDRVIPEQFQNHRLPELIEAAAISAEGVLERSFQAWLHPDVALLKFSGFCQHWRADLHGHEGDGSFTFRAPLPCRSWRWYLGHRSGLEVVIKLRYPTVRGLMATGHVVVQPYGCDVADGGRLLQEFGSRLMRDLLAHLQARPERRAHERHRFDPPLRFYPALPFMDTDAVIEGLGEDLSAVGMRSWTHALPEASHLVIKLPLASEEEPVPVLARVERIRDVEAGGHEVIVHFVRDPQTV